MFLDIFIKIVKVVYKNEAEILMNLKLITLQFSGNPTLIVAITKLKAIITNLNSKISTNSVIDLTILL